MTANQNLPRNKLGKLYFPIQMQNNFFSRAFFSYLYHAVEFFFFPYEKFFISDDFCYSMSVTGQEEQSYW